MHFQSTHVMELVVVVLVIVSGSLAVSGIDPAMCRRLLDATGVGEALEAPFEAAVFSDAAAFGSNSEF